MSQICEIGTTNVNLFPYGVNMDTSDKEFIQGDRISDKRNSNFKFLQFFPVFTVFFYLHVFFCNFLYSNADNRSPSSVDHKESINKISKLQTMNIS